MNQQTSLAISLAKEVMSGIQDAQTELEEIQSQIDYDKDRLVSLLAAHLKGTAVERVRQEASEIYWSKQMRSLSSIIKKAYSQATGQHLFPIPNNMPLWCYVCGGSYNRLIGSWSAIDEIDKNRYRCRGLLEDGAVIHHLFNDIACPDCVEKHIRKTRSDRVKFDQEYAEEIRRLRSMPYAEYLQSEHWQQVRRRELRAANHRCRLCNKESPLQVHHRTYERRGHEEWNDVIALCRPCHEKFHDIVPDPEV